jgi:hypothetical protein
MANFYQFKGATTLRKYVFQLIFSEIKNINGQFFTIKKYSK